MKRIYSIVVAVLVLVLSSAVSIPADGYTFRIDGYTTHHQFIDISHLYRPIWQSEFMVGGSFVGNRELPFGSVIWSSGPSLPASPSRTIRGGYGIPPIPLRSNIIRGGYSSPN